MDRKVTEFLIDMLHRVSKQNVLNEDLRAIIKDAEDDMEGMVEQVKELQDEIKRLKEEG